MNPPQLPTTIDEYIASSEPGSRLILEEIRRIVKAAVPDAKETISYRMPALKQKRVFFYFAAFQHHVGVYPPLRAEGALLEELRPYSNERGNLKFPLNKPIPYELIARVAVALSAQLAKK